VTHYGVTQISYTWRDSDLLLYIGNMTICLGVGAVIEKGSKINWIHAVSSISILLDDLIIIPH
jgi:hypothetical protein